MVAFGHVNLDYTTYGSIWQVGRSAIGRAGRRLYPATVGHPDRLAQRYQFPAAAGVVGLVGSVGLVGQSPAVKPGRWMYASAPGTVSGFGGTGIPAADMPGSMSGLAGRIGAAGGHSAGWR